jgi:Putative MetA-pathway of phenol degradation
MFRIIVTALVLVLFFENVSIAQMPIQLDRPDQTECPFIVPKGYLQAENGLTFENINSENTTLAYPTILWKLGLSRNFEFRLITELVSQSSYGETKKGLIPITVGFKAKIAEEEGMLPSTSFIAHLTIPKAATNNLKTDNYAPSFRFTMQNTLSKKVSLSYNLGAKWNGEVTEATFIYTLAVGYSITNKWGSYIETYGFLPQKGPPDNRLDGGLTYLINNNMMIDISGGIGISENSPKNYFSLGFSYRFNTKMFKN